jgi:hypothetical protein
MSSSLFSVSPRPVIGFGATRYSSASSFSRRMSATSTLPRKTSPVGLCQLQCSASPCLSGISPATHRPSVNFIFSCDSLLPRAVLFHQITGTDISTNTSDVVPLAWRTTLFLLDRE